MVTPFVARALRCVTVAAIALTTRAAAGQASVPATLPDILERSARYVADYQERLSSVVAEEHYDQRVDTISGDFGTFGTRGTARTKRVRRRLTSDYLLVRRPGRSGWVPFRDVFEVDGKPVRDREERLTELFLSSSETARDQAMTIAEESSRFNIGTVRRTVNVPTLALLILASDQQPRFEFQHEDTRRDAGVETWVVSYREQARPTLIRGEDDDDVPAFGDFWIDAKDGRILRSRLRTDDGDLSSEIEVTYHLDDRLGLWVPSRMKERYRNTAGEKIEATATYGRFRQFNVKTTEGVVR